MIALIDVFGTVNYYKKAFKGCHNSIQWRKRFWDSLYVELQADDILDKEDCRSVRHEIERNPGFTMDEVKRVFGELIFDNAYQVKLAKKLGQGTQ